MIKQTSNPAKWVWRLVIAGLVCVSTATVANDIAYLAHSGDYWQVWVMTEKGTDHRQVTHSPYDKAHISRFPDGQSLLVCGNQGESNIVDLTSGQELPAKLPLQGIVDAEVSPNGEHIAFSFSVAGSVDHNDIWVVEKDGGNLRKLTDMKGLQHEPAWSPDGKWIYFHSGSGGQAHNLWRVSLKDLSVEQLTVAQLYHFEATLSFRGDIAYSNNKSGNYELWLIDKDKSPRQLTNNPALDGRPSWSADGKRIAFHSSRDGGMNIWSIDVDSGQPVQLTQHKAGARFPVWRLAR